MNIKFAKFASIVEAAGLVPVDRGDGHWQIDGGPLLVNFYPWARKGSVFYVDRTAGGQIARSVQDVIDAARTPPTRDRMRKTNRRDRKSRRYRNWKVAELKRSKRCYWCGHLLAMKPKSSDERQATLDHVIPLFRGGLDQPSNWVLACAKCNHARGHDMPELSQTEGLECN